MAYSVLKLRFYCSAFQDSRSIPCLFSVGSRVCPAAKLNYFSFSEKRESVLCDLKLPTKGGLQGDREVANAQKVNICYGETGEVFF